MGTLWQLGLMPLIRATHANLSGVPAISSRTFLEPSPLVDDEGIG